MSFDGIDAIQFQVFSTLHRMSLTEFSFWLGHYNVEFTRTPAYDSLMISRSSGESQEDAWQRLSTNPVYDPRKSKTMTLRSPALRYIHFILNHTLTGHGDSTGIVSRHDFDILLSILDRFQLYLGYEVAIFIAHKGTNPRIGSIFVNPYITRLIKGMAILEGTDRTVCEW